MVKKVLFIQPFVLDREQLSNLLLIWPVYLENYLKSKIEDIATEESKRSKGYKLTPSGAEFTDRIFSRFDNLIEVAIQSKLEICASCGVKLYDNYHSEKIGNKMLNFCCKHCAKAYKDNQG